MIMSFKWKENFTLVFLNTYQKHPCLWNPYYVKYYDCLAKNEALKNIIKELNVPELTMSDCLEQIKVIRETYRQEQIRMIKGFQLGKPYNSPFVWFPIIAGMLTKVINDESKLQNRIKSMETMSPLKDCVATPNDKYKSISNFPCVQRSRQDYKIKPRKNTKFTKTEDLDVLDYKSKKHNDAQLLQCPSCGWEDIKPNRLDMTTKKAYEIKSLNIAVPCPAYSNLADKSYERYKAYQYRITDTMYEGKYNRIPCPSFSTSLPSYTRYPADILKTHTYYPRNICNYINQQIISGPIDTSESKSYTRKTQLSNEQLFPEKQTKQIGINIVQYDEGIQNTVCMSKTETESIRKCYKEVQSKPLISQEKLKQVAVNTTQQCNKEIQNTICASLSNCQAFQKYSSTRKAKQIDLNTVKYLANDMRNIIGVKLKSVEGPIPNFILITTNENYLLQQRDLKELAANKCQKDTADQKEMEKAHLALDGKKLFDNEVCIKETCSRDIMEIIKQNSVMTQALLQCLEKLIQEKIKICSVTSFLSKRDNVNSNSSEITVCEGMSSKFANENIDFGTSPTIEIESLSCSPCLEKTEKDNVIAITETILKLMKHAFKLNSKNVQKGCVRKEDAINTFIVLSKIKEYADEILKICTLVDCSKRQLNKFYSKSKSKCPSKRNSTLNAVQTQDIKEDTVNQFTASFANSKDVELLYGPPISKIRDHSLSENDTTYAETMTELSVEDKDVTARIENHDIGLNVSLQQISLRESGTQYTPKQLQDTGIVTDRNFEEKISVATQNDEPMLIRVSKSNNNKDILKLDKETCVRDAYVQMVNVDKYSKNMYQKYSVREYYDELLHPVSHIHKKEVNCIDYRSSLLPFNGIYKYNKRCKSSLPCNHDWTKRNISNVGLASNQGVSKIPLYTRSHKYTRRRTELYRMSYV